MEVPPVEEIPPVTESPSVTRRILAMERIPVISYRGVLFGASRLESLDPYRMTTCDIS
jgi:hypothetical protein